MSFLRRLACVICLAASALAGTASKPANIILITLDTTRADRMGFMGSKAGLTPNLDKLAEESVVFTRAYAQVPLTEPSHATILTGTYPQFHQVTNFGLPLAKDLPYAPAILKAHGYRTAAFIGALALDPAAGAAPGFERGFDTYDAGFRSLDRKDRYHTVERRGGDVVERAAAWLTRHPEGPFLLWVHLYDPHDPYDPPEPFKTKYAAAPYDGEIAYTDSAVGKLLAHLRAHGLYDGAMIAVMADHGEALGDHGEDSHGIFLYDETIHVPLVIKLPAAKSEGAASGQRVDKRVGLVDVLPTILQAVGVAIPSAVQGESLLNWMKAAAENAEGGQSASERMAYAESDYAHDAYGWSPLRSIRTGKYLYIEAPRPELYDQSADAAAERDLARTSTAIAGTLEGQLKSFRQKTSSARVAPQTAVDAATAEKLAALGYVANTGAAKETSVTDQAADPKDKIEISNMIHRANMLMEDERFGEAALLFRQLVAKEPGMLLLYTKLGKCLMVMKDYPDAVPVLRKIAEMIPDATEIRLQLGKVLIATGDFAGAATEFEKVTAKSPKDSQAHLLLATVYVRLRRLPDAVKECDAALAIAPDDYDANLLLGRTLLLSGDAQSAVAKLKKAAALQPKSAGPHLALSDAYLKLGRYEDAAREQFEAKNLGAGGAE